MKKLFNLLVSLYNELFYKSLCRKFKRAVLIFPELKGGIQILEMGFGTGTGSQRTISERSIHYHLLRFRDEQMYFAEVQNKQKTRGYLYLVKSTGYFVYFFNTGSGTETDFSFDPKGIITKEGKVQVYMA